MAAGTAIVESTIPNTAWAARPRPIPDKTQELAKYLPKDYFIHSGPADRRRVALTFDDFSGIETIDYLHRLLNIAKSHNFHITAFPIGEEQLFSYEEKPDWTRSVWRRAIAESNVVGNHTYDHRLLGHLPARQIEQELRKQYRAMNTVLGFRHTEIVARPPGGDGGFQSQEPQYHNVHGVFRRLGYWLTMWTTDSNTPDNRVVTTNEDARFLHKIFHDPAEHVRNGSIILIHPTTLSIDGVHTLVHRLQAMNYELCSVPELFAPRAKWPSNVHPSQPPGQATGPSQQRP